MSVRTMARVWEFSKHAGNDLLMLLAIADFSDDDGRAYPSVPALARKVRMSPRNANKILAALRESGELEIKYGAGPRGTNRYRVNIPLSELTPLSKRTPCQNGPDTPVRIDTPPCQNGPDTPVKTDRRTISEPSTRTISEPSKNTRAQKFDAVAYLSGKGVDAEVVADWLALRKEKRAPATLTVIAGNEHEAVKAGITLADALRIACMRGWASFNADWHANSSTSSKRIPRTEDFANRDYTKGVNPDGTF